MNTLIQFLLSIDPLILYAIGMTAIAIVLLMEVSLNTVHDKSDYQDYPSNPTTSNEESTDGNSSL